MIPKDFRLFPDPDPTPSGSNNGIDKSEIRDVFIVVYNTDGSEMMSFRKSYMDIKNVNIEEMISMHPANNFSSIEEQTKVDLRKKYIGE